MESFLAFYGSNLRYPLFTGFLSLGGFLFAAKTFIVVHMKKEVYDTDRYRERLSEQKRLDAKLLLYQPLKNLNRLLFWAVTLSLVTATSQMSLGLIPYWPAAVICVVLAVLSLASLFIALFQISENMNMWLDDLEKDA